MLYQTHTEWLSTPAAKTLLERNNLDEIRPTEKAGEWIASSEGNKILINGGKSLYDIRQHQLEYIESMIDEFQDAMQSWAMGLDGDFTNLCEFEELVRSQALYNWESIVCANDDFNEIPILDSRDQAEFESFYHDYLFDGFNTLRGYLTSWIVQNLEEEGDDE